MATDVDTVMEAPSVPPPLSSGQPQSRSQHEIIEGHKNLKRQFDQFEEVRFVLYYYIANEWRHGYSPLS